jgi:hypothetical protein
MVSTAPLLAYRLEVGERSEYSVYNPIGPTLYSLSCSILQGYGVQTVALVYTASVDATEEPLDAGTG